MRRHTVEFFGPCEVQYQKRRPSDYAYKKVEGRTRLGDAMLLLIALVIVNTMAAWLVGMDTNATASEDAWKGMPDFIWYVWATAGALTAAAGIGYFTSHYRRWSDGSNTSLAKIVAVRYFKQMSPEYQAGLGGLSGFLAALEDFDYTETYRVNQKMGHILMREEAERQTLADHARAARSQSTRVIEELNRIAVYQSERAEVYKELL